MKERISVTEYNAKDGWTRKEYTIKSEHGVFNKSSNSSSSSGYSGSSSTCEGTPGIRALAVSGMLLASLVVIVILWIVAFRSKSNLFFLTILLTFGILGWDAFVIFICADDFAEVISEAKDIKMKKRQKYRNSHLNSLGRYDYDDKDII